MIKATFKRKDNFIEEINITGHAMYNEYGKDIVCAGVSSSLIVTVNAVLLFDKDAIKYNESNNFNLVNLKKDNITNTLLENLFNSLKAIEKDYKDNIKVKEE